MAHYGTELDNKKIQLISDLLLSLLHSRFHFLFLNQLPSFIYDKR